MMSYPKLAPAQVTQRCVMPCLSQINTYEMSKRHQKFEKMADISYKITPQNEKPRHRLIHYRRKTKTSARYARHADRSSQKLDDRVRTSFPYENLSLFLKRRAYDEYRKGFGAAG